MRVTIPGAPINESNTRGHWAAKAKRTKTARTKARLLLKSALVKAPLPPLLRIEMTRYGPRQLDFDGLTSSLKATRDGLADALGFDDGTPLVEWRYLQARGEPRVEVEVVRLTPDDIVSRRERGLVETWPVGAP